MSAGKKNGTTRAADRTWSAEEIAGTNLIAFQGGVYDLDDFAHGHPGGADLVKLDPLRFTVPPSFV